MQLSILLGKQILVEQDPPLPAHEVLMRYDKLDKDQKRGIDRLADNIYKELTCGTYVMLLPNDNNTFKPTSVMKFDPENEELLEEQAGVKGGVLIVKKRLSDF